MHDQFNQLHINSRVMEFIASIEETQSAAPGGEGPSQVLATAPQVPRTYSRRIRGTIIDSSSVPPSEPDLNQQVGNQDSPTFDQGGREEANQASQVGDTPNPRAHQNFPLNPSRAHNANQEWAPDPNPMEDPWHQRGNPMYEPLETPMWDPDQSFDPPPIRAELPPIRTHLTLPPRADPQPQWAPRPSEPVHRPSVRWAPTPSSSVGPTPVPTPRANPPPQYLPSQAQTDLARSNSVWVDPPIPPRNRAHHQYHAYPLNPLYQA